MVKNGYNNICKEFPYYDKVERKKKNGKNQGVNCR